MSASATYPQPARMETFFYCYFFLTLRLLCKGKQRIVCKAPKDSQTPEIVPVFTLKY